jgi:hypothetical protein
MGLNVVLLLSFVALIFRKGALISGNSLDDSGE